MQAFLLGLLFAFHIHVPTVAVDWPDPQATESRLPVYMYHYIRVPDPKDRLGVGLSVTPDVFEMQLKQLKAAHRHTITSWQMRGPRVETGSVLLTFDDGYEDFYTTAYPLLEKYQMTGAVAVITDKIGQPGYLTADQILDIHKHGIEIMSHTRQHKDLNIVSSLEARDEIFGSKTILEHLLQEPINSFVYPSGKYNEVTLKLVQEAGYRYAFTTKPGDAHLNHQNALELHRHRITSDVKEMPL